MEFFKALGRFFLAAGLWGIGLMTGGIVAYGMALYEHTSGKSLPAALWVGLGMFLFSLGSFLAWRGEEKCRIGAQANLLKLTVPNLVLSVHEMWVSFDPRVNLTNVLISASVINNGASSPALGWNIRFQTPTMQMGTIHSSLPYENNSWTLPYGNQALVLHAEKMLEAKTEENIPSGECRSGRLLFQLIGDVTYELNKNNCQIWVGTTDRLGVAVWQVLSDSARGGTPMSLPGEKFITLNQSQPMLPE